jgi:hypothetical protein
MGKKFLADTVVMVSPDHFGFNPQTAPTNSFQKQPTAGDKEVTELAKGEFEAVVKALEANGIETIVLPSRPDVITPDAIFPNNWFSTDTEGNLVIYPLLSENRREERQLGELIDELENKKFKVERVVDLSDDESEDKALEGTGSMVFDWRNRVAYAMASARTDEILFRDFCERFDFEPVFFHAFDKFQKPIYHTNVMLTIGDGFAIVCLEAITDAAEREMVFRSLSGNANKGDAVLELVEISLDQLYKFCGNCLHLASRKGDKKIIMSYEAYLSFDSIQKRDFG